MIDTSPLIVIARPPTMKPVDEHRPGIIYHAFKLVLLIHGIYMPSSVDSPKQVFEQLLRPRSWIRC